MRVELAGTRAGAVGCRRRVGEFAKAGSQRLGLAAAMLGDPGVLVLDEPTNGLDPEGVRWLRGYLLRLAAEGRTVFASSHALGEVERTADHVLVITYNGRLWSRPRRRHPARRGRASPRGCGLGRGTPARSARRLRPLVPARSTGATSSSRRCWSGLARSRCSECHRPVRANGEWRPRGRLLRGRRRLRHRRRSRSRSRGPAREGAHQRGAAQAAQPHGGMGLLIATLALTVPLTAALERAWGRHGMACCRSTIPGILARVSGHWKPRRAGGADAAPGGALVHPGVPLWHGDVDVPGRTSAPAHPRRQMGVARRGQHRRHGRRPWSSRLP